MIVASAKPESDRRDLFLMMRPPTFAVLGMLVLLVSCGTGTSSSPLPEEATTVDASCPDYSGFPVVWSDGYRFADGLIHPPSTVEREPWPVDQSSFQIVSAYWALTPNYMSISLDPSSRGCINEADRWMARAYPPDTELGWADVPYGDPADFDTSEWDLIVAHPWQLDRLGPPGSADQAPHYRGVVRFTDQLAVTASTCDTLTNRIFIRGEALAPSLWPGDQPMICVTPPGVEPPPDGGLDPLPIVGVPELREGQLLITHQGIEYWYVPITEEEFVAAFDRESVFEIEDPLSVLQEYEAANFEEIDNPSQTTQTTEP
jgi:hypothetical protein